MRQVPIREVREFQPLYPGIGRVLGQAFGQLGEELSWLNIEDEQAAIELGTAGRLAKELQRSQPRFLVATSDFEGTRSVLLADPHRQSGRVSSYLLDLQSNQVRTRSLAVAAVLVQPVGQHQSRRILVDVFLA